MAVNSIDSSSTGNVSSSTLLKNDQVSSNEFLQLLVTQLKNQDPLDPLSSEEFMGQLAQFQSLSELMDLNKNSSSMLLSQQITEGASLIGKQVTGIDSYWGYVEGTVDKIFIDGNSVYLDVNGVYLKVNEVTEVAGDDSLNVE